MRIVALLTLLLSATAANAQSSRQCGPRERVLGILAERYGETRQSIGLTDDGKVVEVFASNDSGTWTVIVTLPSGLACLVASGSSFELAGDDRLPAPGDPS